MLASARGDASVTCCHNLLPPASLSMPHRDTLLLWALTGPLTPLAPASAPALTVVAAALAAALVGAYVALAVLLLVAVLRVVHPRPDGRP
jgi:hypothetical protein